MSQRILEKPAAPAATLLPEVAPVPSAVVAQLLVDVREPLTAIAIERDRHGGVPREEVGILRGSPLLGLAVPAEYGGLGAPVSTILWAIRQVGAIDGGLSRLFGYHLLIALWIRLLGTSAEQQTFYYGQVIKDRAWLGNASLEGGRTVVDIGTRVTRDGNRYHIDGRKIFSTGAIVSDWLLTGGAPDGLTAQEGWAWVLIPSTRAGITISEDWDPLGQKAAYSGSVHLDRVEVRPQEVLRSWEYEGQSAFTATLILLFQIQQANTILGIAQGALAAAREYTRTHTRPWPLSGKDRATQDPYILERYGEFFTELAAAEAFVDRVGRILEDALNKGESLTWEERGHASALVLAAKAVAAKASNDVTQRLFETTGARSVVNRGFGLDRYWRNARTETLHSPLVYHLSAVGNYVLNAEPPASTFYS
jgi:alkylation response protein AidB-like acyl-CoA dehydrogenase